MTKTAGVAFPTWTAMEDSVQITSSDRYAMYVGDRVFEGDAPIDPIGSTRTLSIILVCTIDSGGSSVLKLEDPSWTTPSGNSDKSFNIRMIGNSLLVEVFNNNGNGNQIKFTYDTNIVLGDPYHIAYTEQGPSAPGGAESKLYINGILEEETTLDIVWSGDTPRYLVAGTADMKIAGLRVYDRILSSSQILEDYNRASAPPIAETLSEVESATIEDVNQREFNGLIEKNTTNELTFIDSDSATFKIANYRDNSSFPLNATTGIPRGGWAHIGSTATFEGDTFDEGFDIISVVSIGGTNLEIEIDRAATFSINEDVIMSGLEFITTPTDNPFAGRQVITSAPSTTKFQIASTFTEIGDIILNNEPAQFLLDAPASFSSAEEIIGSAINPSATFDGLSESQKYTVRVRSESIFGGYSKWVTDSIIATRNDNIPRAPFFTVTPGSDVIVFNVKLGADLTGADDSDFHRETNIDYVELVVANNGEDRPDGSTDPGADTSGVDPERVLHRLSLPNNITEIGTITTQVPVNNRQRDYYAWARLVSTSGVVSDWYPDDSGISADRDRFAPTPILIGVGPVNTSGGGSSTNTLPTTTADTLVLDTTTVEPEGPAPVGGADGFY
jgi:hypothetical protein